MTEKQIDTITDAEWEVMRVVWAKCQTTSNEIITVLQRKKEWKPSTVKTLLARLVAKGCLNTQKEGKQLVYHASILEDDAIKKMRKNFLNKICQKKVGIVLVDTILEEELSLGDIEKIEKSLKKKKQTAKDFVSCSCVPGQCNCK